MELFDPEANQVFVDHLKAILNPRIPVEEMDVHISDPAFATRAVEIMDLLIRENLIRPHR
jgi:uncharacterized protein (UPF0261 family)